jgi:PTH1 family peptidyl-tRNA hydrolase
LKVILGLGNPGKEYEATRHNVGWWVLDHLADVWRFDGWRKDGKAKVTSGPFGGTTVRLVKPLTYVNLSGAALRPYLRRPTWNPAKDLLVVTDDVALPLGRFRLRARGSHGGHNGLRSIEQALQSREYARMRIGVGPPPELRQPDNDLADFVLAPFGRAERAVVNALKPRLAEAAETWVRDGIETAMNAFNRGAEITSR